MKKLLVSWVSDNTDFDKSTPIPKVNRKGPSFDMQQSFSGKYDRHILLSTAHPDKMLPYGLKEELDQSFKDRRFGLECLDIPDPMDYLRVKTKFDKLMSTWSKEAEQIDLMFTTGTSIMRLVMFLAHLTFEVKTRLFQGRPPKIQGQPWDFTELHLEKDPSLQGLYLRFGEFQLPGVEFIMTKSLEPVYKQADRVSLVDWVNVLILGASGTGKEHLAKTLHENSGRKDKKFIPVNCASISDELLHSELFGHKAGSFTSAHQDRTGYFEEAQGGTIFLDEIGDTSLKIQQSLLRVIEEKKIQRLGDSTPIEVDIRILAATHQNLHDKIERGEFREDLYYRLSDVELYLPRLQDYEAEERKAFIEKFFELKKKDFSSQRDLKLSKEVLDRLLKHPFPGNIRELNKILTHFFVFSRNTVELKDLPPRLKMQEEEAIWSLAQAEKKHILKVLDFHQGNLTHTSETLDISYNKLDRRLKLYGLKGKKT